MAFESRGLRALFGPDRVEILESWIKPRGDEIHDFYSYPCFIKMIELRKMRSVGMFYSRVKRNACRYVVGTPEGRGPVGRPRREWEDYTNMAVKGTELDGRGLNSGDSELVEGRA